MCRTLPKTLGGVFLVTLFLSTVVSGATLMVRQDGSGDYLTIPPAYAAASECCDTIDVGPGTYTDSLYVSKRLVFIGSSGAEVTVLDGEGMHRIIVFQAGSSGSVVSGFTFKRGMGDNGGAVRVQAGASVVVRSCLFVDNVATYDGAAFFVRHAGSHLTLEDCTFTGNHTGHNGGAGNIIESGTLDVTRCLFRGNSTGVVSGAVAAHYAMMNVASCLFDGNTSGDVAGALYYYYSGGSVRNNTFSGNSSPGHKAGTIVIQNSWDVLVEENIISNAQTGYGLWDERSGMPHSCNLYWNNSAGALGGSTTMLDSTEVVANPLYCNPAMGDFTIAYQSSAAPEHNSCALLIGAFPPACDAVEPPQTHNRLRVRQDGSGDFLAIPPAYAAASECCDTIDVGPGTYTDSLYVSKRLVFIGSSGAEVTVLDGEGMHRIIVFQAGSSGSVVSGFTVKRGMGDNGGAVRVQAGASVVIRSCLFVDNVATYDGAAFFVRHAGSHLTLEDCTFTGNHTGHNGGAGNIIESGTLDVTRCLFRGNSTGVVSGAVAAHYATMNVTSCLFDGNTSADVSGAMYYYYSNGVVRSNTFNGNASPGLRAATVFIHCSPNVVVERNIISNDQAGCGFWDLDSFVAHTCNLYWNNVDGCTGGSASLDPTEIVADPIYCNAPVGDYTVAYTSPAASEHNSCALLIGAFPPACGEEIATLLRSYSAAREDNAIAVRWTLSEGSDAPAFTVSRARDGDDFAEIPEAVIASTGRSYSFTDNLVEPGAAYRYRIEYRSAEMTRQLFETEAIAIPPMPITLFQNYPNPFNPATTIKFYLPKPADVTLDVFDISGRLVAALAHGRLNAGSHEVEWRGMNLNGKKISSGIYFYRLRAGKDEIVRKMILLR